MLSLGPIPFTFRSEDSFVGSSAQRVIKTLSVKIRNAGTPRFLASLKRHNFNAFMRSEEGGGRRGGEVDFLVFLAQELIPTRSISWSFASSVALAFLPKGARVIFL